MKFLRLKLEAAGLAKYSTVSVVFAILVAGLITASWVQLSFKVWGLTLSAFLATVGVSLEAIQFRANQRSDALRKIWPEVIDSLQSAAGSGFSMVEAFDELARSGPNQVRKEFHGLIQRLDAGWNMESALSWLKRQFGEPHADRVIELLLATHQFGGAGYLDSLRTLAKNTRADQAVLSEVLSKQGWVKGTAKLALAAPWAIVATLAVRGENVQIYNSAEGFALLSIGLAVSLAAYRAINVLGRLSEYPRIFLK